MLNKYLIAETNPKARENQIIIVDDIRITVLSPISIRLEQDKEKRFCDKATQIVWFREFPQVEYKIKDDKKGFFIVTDSAEFHFNKKEKDVDYVVLNGKKVACTNKNNLKGTARTLDMESNGNVKLENGIISKDGVAYFWDNSHILDVDGEIKERKNPVDKYIFASTDHRKTLQAYFQITGYPPIVPRYALGNWWSRYHAYTQQEYLDLMKRFQQENIPFSVATIDMDWHYVNLGKDVGKKYARMAGWTGYTWNERLFPDYRKFLQTLQNDNYKTSLNLHPAKGVRPYEKAYGAMCEYMGLDASKQKTIPFDITDSGFLNAYFDVLHKPYEKEGVDIWWIDWQQGKKTKIKGYDPLWGLNHYHSLYSGRNGLRPMILSRYSGLGSHRYPLGFSGDTFIKWSVLRFQPYFTATAANCGYFNWSHDIGGHHFGKQYDEELYCRWVQLGVFSPILRLHSTKIVIGKEPWLRPTVKDIAIKWLNYRMRLIPYIYTANYNSFKEGRAICEPLYYTNPDKHEAYEYKTEYYFGSELLVAPVTDKKDKKTGKTDINVWLPEGDYTEIFTGIKYKGGKDYDISCPMEYIPVFAKSGAIIPLSDNVGNDTFNPESLEVMVYAGNNSYTMYEDDGITYEYLNEENSSKTTFNVEYDRYDLSFRFSVDNLKYIPENRTYRIRFADVKGYDNVIIKVDGKESSSKVENGCIVLRGKEIKKASVVLKGVEIN